MPKFFLKFVRRYYLLFFLSFVLYSCSKRNDSKPSINFDIKVVEAKGIEFSQQSIKPPKIIDLAKMPKPQVIEIPTEAEGSYVAKNGKKIFPPEIKQAGILYFIQKYTSDQGLALDQVRAGTIDKKGNLWFATAGGGASKYDGKSFTNYNKTEGLLSGRLFSILADTKGNIWFGTASGVSKYDGISFSSYTQDQGLANNRVNYILEDKKGNFWFGTNGGSSLYDGKVFKSYMMADGLANDQVYSILEDKEGNIWFGTEGGVSKFDGKSFTTYTETQGLANNHVYSILEDKEGNLWFGTDGGGASKYDGKSFSTYTTKEGLVNDRVTSMHEDKGGNLWFGTYGGVSKYDMKTFRNYTTAEGLSNPIIRTIIEDKNGIFWFGTEGGVNRYSGNAFTFYTMAQGLPNDIVRTILEDKSKNLWFGTNGGGVSKYDGKTFTNYSTDQGLAGTFPIIRGALEDSKGHLWFGTIDGGASEFDGKSFTNYTKDQGLTGNDVRCIIQDNKGNLWFGTAEGGASKYDGKSFTNYTTDQGLASNRIKTIFEDGNGNLWFGTMDGGLSKFDGKTFINFTTNQGLNNNYVMDILDDKEGNLWLGTDGGGIARYDGKSFMTYTTTEGLANDNVYCLIITQQKNLAIGTNNGLSILTGYSSNSFFKSTDTNESAKLPFQNHLTNEELKYHAPVFEIFNDSTSYPIRDLNGGQGSLFMDSLGMIWFGTGIEKIGLVRFDYSALHKNKIPPSPIIQAVKINNEHISWYDLSENETEIQNQKTIAQGITIPPNLTEEAVVFGKLLSDAEREAMRQKFGDIKFDGITKFNYVPENLELPHKHNHITFDFGAIEPDSPQNILYQYKLEGYDKDWSPTTHQTSATYGNIYEGYYEFKVRAKGTYSDWSEPIIYTFNIWPPWYRTWWAYSIYALSSITIIYLISLWRTAVLRKRFEELQILYHSVERFVPKAFLNLLQKENIEDIKLGDYVVREITVLFNDIRNFTTLIENITPKEAFDFVNRYWEFMAPVIRQNGGYIDQCQGDAILAIFPNKPEDGLRASIGMMKALSGFNENQAKRREDIINVGIGISTGLATLGIIGEKKRHVSGIISDVAHAATRIESLTKIYGASVLVSGEIAKTIPPQSGIILRRIDRLHFKGKMTSTEIFEIVDWFTKLKGITLEEYLQIFYKSQEKYFNGEFEEAKIGFEKCLIHFPDDKSTVVLYKRCCVYSQEGSPPNWSGVFIYL